MGKSLVNSCENFTVFNVKGIKPQTVPSSIPYISSILHDHKQLFIALTETWLRDHNDAELDIEGYKTCRCDRSVDRNIIKRGRCSGGVAFYLRKDIASKFK